MKKDHEVKADTLARIRFYGPTAEDIADERPRVRRAALCYMAASGSAADCVKALDIAVSSTATIFLPVIRTVLLKRVALNGVAAREAVQAAIELRVERLGEPLSFADFGLAV